jgi:three-Cys-motif partner protein
MHPLRDNNRTIEAIKVVNGMPKMDMGWRDGYFNSRTSTNSNFGGFGGHWSDVKLAAVREYFSRFNTALSKTSFTRVYIDGFAGGGRISPKDSQKLAQKRSPDGELFSVSNEAEDEEAVEFRHGSPLLALEANPPFDEFIFIERDPETLDQLQKQIASAGILGGRRVQYLCEDSNVALNRLSLLDWSSRRATVFLDPFALHIAWSTLEAIASTKAMDMWLLFPAMAVNRMLPRNAEVPEAWARRLDETFGDTSWRQAFYAQPEASPNVDLFPDFLPTVKDEKLDDPFGRLSRYVTARLKTVFADAVDEPLVLKTASGSPLFLLSFAVANERGAPIAKRIANHIITKQRHGY